MGTESKSLLREESANPGGAEAIACDVSEPDEVHEVDSPSTSRWVALLSVPMLWGSYCPSMKLLLNQKHPPPAILTNLVSLSLIHI